MYFIEKRQSLSLELESIQHHLIKNGNREPVTLAEKVHKKSHTTTLLSYIPWRPPPPAPTHPVLLNRLLFLKSRYPRLQPRMDSQPVESPFSHSCLEKSFPVSVSAISCHIYRIYFAPILASDALLNSLLEPYSTLVVPKANKTKCLVLLALSRSHNRVC